jgi:hypothetical protein
MSTLKNLETQLNGVFGKNTPKLPSNGRRVLVEYLPWINLVLGVLTLLAALALWNWAHVANNLVDYANRLSAAYGGPQVATQRLTFMIWLGMIVLVAEALLYIAAFPALRARKKSGWNLLFYALLVNVVYGVVVLFTDYGGLGSFIGTLIGSAVGLYFLFQIRPAYSASGAAKKA